METTRLESARIRRHKRLASARLYVELSLEQDLSWDDLVSFPEWCYLSKPLREKFLLICGALLISPAMRLWIDGKKLNSVRKILGGPIFQAVMHSQLEVDLVYSESLTKGNLQSVLKSSGATVVYSAANNQIQELVASIAGSAVGVLSAKVAESVLLEAFNISRVEGFDMNSVGL